MISLELITMLGSSVLGGVMTLWSKSMENKRQQTELMLQRSKQQETQTENARRMVGFHWTRRILALGAFFFLCAWPKIVCVVWPEIPVWVSWTDVDPGFLFFKDAHEVISWKPMTGVVITPLDNSLMSAIIGFFLGNQVSK